MNLIQWTSLIISVLTIFMLMYLFKYQVGHRHLISATLSVAIHATIFYTVVALDPNVGIGKYVVWSSVLRFHVFFTFFVTTIYRVIKLYRALHSGKGGLWMSIW